MNCFRNIKYIFKRYRTHATTCLVSLGDTGREDISMQFASWNFRPCWIYTPKLQLNKKEKKTQI